MITSIALTITQPSQRPLHISTCSITPKRDHFEFIAHSPAATTSSAKNSNSNGQTSQPTNDPYQKALSANPYSRANVDPNRNSFNQQESSSSSSSASYHLGSYRGVDPSASSSSSSKNVPRNALSVFSDSMTASSLLEPTPSFIVRLFFKDITKIEIISEICQIIVSTTSPTHTAFYGPAASDSVSPDHRQAFFEQKIITEDDSDEFVVNSPSFNSNNNKNNKFNSQSDNSRSGGKHFFENGSSQADEFNSNSPNRGTITSNNNTTTTAVTTGQKSVGGIKRQYVLIFAEDHITETWYKAITRSVEDWAVRVAGASVIKRDENHESFSNINNNQKLQLSLANELLVADDVLDVEKAISNLDRTYYRDDFGWGSPKQVGMKNGSLDVGGEGKSDDNPTLSKARQEAFVQQRQNQLNDMKRKLLPMWGDVTAARNEIVQGILKKGALPMVEAASSPRREQTFELVKQAKLMELKELERTNQEKELEGEKMVLRRQEDIQQQRQQQTSGANTESSSSSIFVPLLSVQSKPATKIPLLSTVSNTNRNHIVTTPQIETISRNNQDSPYVVPLLSTNSEASKIPLLSLLQHPIQPISSLVLQPQQNDNHSGLNNFYTPTNDSIVPSRSGTPPPRNPADENNTMHNNHVPLLSTAKSSFQSVVNYGNNNNNNSNNNHSNNLNFAASRTGASSSISSNNSNGNFHYIPTSSTAVFPPSSLVTTLGKNRSDRVVVIMTPKN